MTEERETKRKDGRIKRNKSQKRKRENWEKRRNLKPMSFNFGTFSCSLRHFYFPFPDFSFSSMLFLFVWRLCVVPDGYFTLSFSLFNRSLLICPFISLCFIYIFIFFTSISIFLLISYSFYLLFAICLSEFCWCLFHLYFFPCLFL